jgi:hypothetical protein
MTTISYAITACNEHVELDRLLEQLTKYIRPEDEIVVQMDITATDEVKNVVSKYKLMNYFYPLSNDFATFKNNLTELCQNEIIFQIDADEYPHQWLIENIPTVMESNPEVDVLLVPRINTVEGLTQEHIQQWRWHVEQDRINFPDYQWRIWRNKKDIKWINKVHERLDGFQSYTNLPSVDECCLYHPKTIERQEKQNAYYSTL